ncbi:MAG: hypothetical protein EHM40_06230 [Chloroflexi bacterium]|nr:MAG: hypothetical protein EHM40_06230 [Chloroflexota bacterium]
MFLNQYLVHRPGAAQTRFSGGGDQSNESEFVFVEIEVFLDWGERSAHCIDHFTIHPEPPTTY